MPEPGSVIVSPWKRRYGVVRLLGHGHYGSVFECRGPFDQTFALKVQWPANRPHEEVREAWLQEAHRLYKLRHPNIVYVHEVFEQGGLFFLVLERLDHSLEDMLGRPFTDRLVIDLSRQLLFALQYLHDNDVIHNDVHAGNVLVSQGEPLILKISDFGIAQDLYGKSSVRPPVVNNRIMAPEAARGGYTTTQSDLYQLGLLMYEMHTGDPPVDLSVGYEGIVQQVRQGVPRGKAEALGTPLGGVISVLLRRSEQYRFNSPEQVWSELRELDAWKNRNYQETLEVEHGDEKSPTTERTPEARQEREERGGTIPPPKDEPPARDTQPPPTPRDAAPAPDTQPPQTPRLRET